MRRFLLALPLLLAGCFEQDRDSVLFADGSGKITWTVRVKADDDEDEGIKDDGLDDFYQSADGIAAWARAERTRKDGYVTIRLVAYFEDINKVRLRKDKDDEEVILSFAYEKAGDGGTLTIDDRTVGNLSKDMGKGNDSNESREQSKKMMKGFRYGVTAVLPGAVTTAPESMTKDGRKAKTEVSEQLLMDGIDGDEAAIAKLEAMKGPWAVKWEKNEVPAEELEAFKKEMAAAKEASGK